MKRNCQLVRVEQTVRCDNDVTGYPHEPEVHRMCVCQKSSQSKGEGKAHCLVVVVVVVVFTRPTYTAIGMLPTDVIQTDLGLGSHAHKNPKRRDLFIFLDEQMRGSI